MRPVVACRRPRPASVLRGLSLLPLLALVPSAQARAQGGTVSLYNVYCGRAENTNGQYFATNGAVSRGCAYRNDTQDWGTGFTGGSAVGGVLRATTAITPGDGNTGGALTALAEWRDQIVVTGSGAAGAAPAFARLTHALNGRLETDGAHSAYTYFNYSNGFWDGSAQYAVGWPNGAGSRDVNASFSFLVPLGFRGGNVWSGAFYMGLGANAQQWGGAPNQTGVRNQFGNSAGVTAVELLDGDQRAVEGATYAFRDGLQLYAASTVPEPGTWALLGTGLLALGGVAVRRRRRVV